MRNYNYIDLFSGVGGLSLGFDRAGFTNIFSVENDKDFAQIYSQNLKDHKVLCKDIEKVSEDEIKSLTAGRTADIVVGGPPCQGFSLAGRIGRTFLDDPRNYLFREFARFVSVIGPEMFLLENVSALEKHNGGRTLAAIEAEFGKMGYIVRHKVLNSKYYGVPQERRRIVIVGKKNRFNFVFPEGDENFIGVKEAIGDLPELASGESSAVPNHVAMNHSAQMLEKMKYVKDGGDRKDIPEELRPGTGDARKYIRYDSRKPSICITGDMRKVFHYEQNRALTNRELARLQTFPDDFVFTGKNIKIQQGIGNAVPPQLAFVLANAVREALNGKVSED